MKMKKESKFKIWSKEKKLRNVAFLMYEDYKISEKELEECKRIIDNLQERSKVIS